MIDDDRCDFFVKKLIQEGKFTINQLLNAEKWILYGDWTYKGDQSKKLLLSDFYPSLSQLRSIQSDSMRILSKEELAQIVKGAYDEGERVGAERAKTEYIAKEKENKVQSELLKSNLRMKEELRVSAQTLATLQTEVFDIKEKLRQKELSEQQQFIAIFGKEPVT